MEWISKMKSFHLIFFFLLMFGSTIFAQRPFTQIDSYIERHDVGWQESRLELSKLFQKERTRLGSQFEVEVWKYIGSSERKCYWIALFLDSNAYLHDSLALPELAFAIRQRGLELGPEKLTGKTVELNPDKPDVRALVRNISMFSLAAISAKKIGKIDIAISLKHNAVAILSNNQDLLDYFPKLNKFDTCIYENINLAGDRCIDEKEKDTSEGFIKDGVMNGKLLFVPNPQSNGSKGQVTVEVIVDEKGRVKSVIATKGPTELFRLAEQAALNAKFAPTIFYGRPWVVTSSITFNFR